MYLTISKAQLMPADVPVYYIVASGRYLECPDSDILAVDVRLDDGRTQRDIMECYWQDQGWYGLRLWANISYKFLSGNTTRLVDFHFVLVSREADPARLADYFIAGIPPPLEAMDAGRIVRQSMGHPQ